MNDGVPESFPADLVFSKVRFGLYEYTYDGVPPLQSKQIWSRLPLQPFSDILSPFSFSVLAEISRRAWFHYYEQMGLKLPFAPRNIIRHYYGRPYLDIKWLCERDVELAALNPMVFQINGKTVPICTSTKPGFLASFGVSRSRRRIQAQLDKFEQEIASVTAKSRTWYAKVREMSWSQAEILQIMEEIERYGVDSLMIFYAARHNLERAYNALLQFPGKESAADRVQMINNTLSDLQGLVELKLTDELLQLAELVRRDQTLRNWLKADQFDDWENQAPDPKFRDHLRQLLQNYGHWATGEGEMANERWIEQPRFLFKGILACAENNAKQPARIPSTAAVNQLLNSINTDERKAAEQHLARIRTLSVLQSHALNAFACILAGTRIWARAAGQEALEDGRIQSLDDTFFFELEEIKQMMTGEWNITYTVEIQATAEKRRADYQQWQQAQPGDLLFDNTEAYPIHHGLPAVVGEATGPLRRQKGLQPILCKSAVVGTRQLDSGWAPTLPVAGALLAAAGTPLDPIVAAARIWHVPTIVALGPHYDGLVDGAQTRIDGGNGAVEQ
jgi:rifampicin phosphotransferase